MDRRLNWLLGDIKFRWVAIWWIIFAAWQIASVHLRVTTVRGADQLKDSTDTPALRWAIGNDPFGYVAGVLVFIAVLVSVRWVVHTVKCCVDAANRDE